MTLCPVHGETMVKLDAPVSGGFLLACPIKSCQQSRVISAVNNEAAVPVTAVAPSTRPSKWKNVPTVVNGIRFASIKESKRYSDLLFLEGGGIIQDLRLQVRYPLVVNGYKVAVYVCDFAYVENGVEIVEDVKGGSVRTPAYRLKCKLMKACYGVTIKET